MSQHYLKMGKNFTFPDYGPQYPRDPTFKLKHYRLELEVDIEDRSIHGRACVTICPVSDSIPVRIVELDAEEMKIEKIEAPFPHKYSYDGRKITIIPDSPLTSEESIIVEYYAKPRRGLYFMLPDEYQPHRAPTIWSQGEPEYNRFWMPIYDYPNNKCTSEVIVTIDREYTVVSNGVLISVEEKENKKKWHWRMDKPHSTYLISIAAGHFAEIRDKVDDIDLFYYVPKGREADAPRTFGKTPDMIRFFSEYLGMKYPYERYSQVCVTEFIVGGMENITATTLTDLTLHDEHAHQDFTSDPLVAHELAHQWFGDLVTMKDWAHIWLNESFATYLENLFLRKDKGEEEFIYELNRDLQAYLEEYRSRYSRPIVMRVYKYPEELFDNHSYPKGSLILHTLNSLIGEENFRKALKLFLERYSFSNADTEDFRKVLEEVSGKNLEWFFEQFIYSAGHPVLKISYSWDEEKKLLKLNIKQTQEDDSPAVYTIPLEIVFNLEDREEKLTLELKDRENTFYIPLKSRPWHICIDPEFKVFKSLDAERPLEELIEMLAKCRFVNCRLEAAHKLGDIGGFRAVEALEKAVKEDRFWGVSAVAAKSLGNIGSDDSLEALIRCLESVKHPKVRNPIAEALGKFKRNRKAAEALKKILETSSESYYVRMQAAISLGKINLPEYKDTLIKALNIPSHNNVITAGALHGLAELGDEESFKIILEHTDLRKPNTIRIPATIALAKFPGRKETYQRLAELSEDRFDRVRGAVIQAAREMLDPKLLPMLDKMSERDLNDRIRRLAREVARKIREQMERGVEYKELREEIEKIREENRKIIDRIARIEVKGI